MMGKCSVGASYRGRRFTHVVIYSRDHPEIDTWQHLHARSVTEHSHRASVLGFPVDFLDTTALILRSCLCPRQFQTLSAHFQKEDPFHCFILIHNCLLQPIIWYNYLL